MTTAIISYLTSRVRPSHELLETLLNATVALKVQNDDYRKTGRFHVDCCCDGCKAMERWLDLSAWQKFRAKRKFIQWLDNAL